MNTLTFEQACHKKPGQYIATGCGREKLLTVMVIRDLDRYGSRVVFTTKRGYYAVSAGEGT